MTTKVRAGIYLRISLDRNASNAGVDRQEQDCKALAQSLGWTVAEVYTDNDTSAFKKSVKRPGYNRLWRDVESGKVTGVLAYHSKRLYRRLTDLEKLIDLIEEHGRVPIKTVASGDLDLSSAAGRAMARILGALGQMESEEMGERIRRQKKAVAETGAYAGGQIGYGYRFSKSDGKVINLKEAALLQEAAAKIVTQHWSFSETCKWLNESGRLTRGGSKWTVTRLTGALTNPAIIGHRVYRGEDIGPADWLPILEDSTWHELVAKRNETRERFAGRRSPEEYPLTGILLCGTDGERMYGNTSRGRRVYKHGGHNGIKADDIERELAFRVSGLVLPKGPPVLDPMKMETADRDALVKIQRDIDELHKLDMEPVDLARALQKKNRERDAIYARTPVAVTDDSDTTDPAAYFEGVVVVPAKSLNDNYRAGGKIIPIDDRIKVQLRKGVKVRPEGPPVPVVEQVKEGCTVVDRYGKSCDAPRPYVRGLCDTHYSRWRRTGDVGADVPIRDRLTTKTREVESV
jgi:site-specific DNA recombinase